MVSSGIRYLVLCFSQLLLVLSVLLYSSIQKKDEMLVV